MRKQHSLTNVNFKGVDIVDTPAHEGATIALAKAKEKLKKELTLSVSAYFWDLNSADDILWAEGVFNRLVEDELPVVAKAIMDKAAKLGVNLTSGGPIASYLMKAEEPKGDEKLEETEMSKETEELTKKNKELTEKNAELTKKLAETEKSLEGSKAPIYKALNGKEYTGDVAEMWRELDNTKSDIELEKRALALPAARGELAKTKVILKALEGIEDEDIRKEAIAKHFRKVDAKMEKRYAPKGSEALDPDASETDIQKSLDGLIQKRMDTDKMDYSQARRAVFKENPEMVNELMGGYEPASVT